MFKIEKKYICHVCGKSFKNPQGLNSHISYVHSKTSKPSEFQFKDDTELQDLRKKIAKRKLERELEGLEEYPKLITIAERVKTLELQHNRTEKDIDTIIRTEKKMLNLTENISFHTDLLIAITIALVREGMFKKSMLTTLQKAYPKEIQEVINHFKTTD